jgi:WD40 repeat protein
VQVWDIETGQLIRALPGTSLAELAIQGFLTGTNSSLVVAGCLNGRVITWDASTGQILHDFTGENLFSIAAVPGTNQILTAHSDNLARVKNAQDGTTLRTIAGHTTSTTLGVGFSPDRRYLVSGGSEALTRIWNRTNAQQVHAFPGYAGGTEVAGFSPDGTRILTTLRAQLFRATFECRTGAIEWSSSGTPVGCSRPSFARYSALLPAPRGTARLWDVATGTQIRAFSRPGSWMTAVAVSSNGMTLASGASDGFVRL